MRLLKTIALAIAAVALVATGASADSLSLVLTGTTGDSPIVNGSDVTFGSGGGSATYSISLETATGFAQFSFSASAPGADITGTTTAALDPGFGSSCFNCLVTPLGSPNPGTDAAGQWAGSANPPAPTGVQTAGTYTLGTITIAVSAPGVYNVQFGILDALGTPNVDGYYDPNFQTLAGSLSNAAATITVVPEPGTALLMGLGIVGLAVAGRRD